MMLETMPAVSMMASSTPEVVRPKVWMTQRIIRLATGVLTRAAVMPKDARIKKVVGLEKPASASAGFSTIPVK